MNIRRPSAIRDAIGFLAGGFVAAACTAFVFLAFMPLGDTKDMRNHVPEAFMLTIIVLFFCGGFIGRRGFSADAWSDFVPSIVATYIAALILPLMAGLSFRKIGPFLGFASCGVATAVLASLLFRKWFPIESSCEQD